MTDSLSKSSPLIHQPVSLHSLPSIMESNGGDSSSALIFMGTGCSGGLPHIMCLLKPSDPPCPVCSPSLTLPPHLNPNYRGNTSLLIDYCQKNGKHSYIQIDVGKTFRESVLRWFTYYNIPQVDSIILTHEHADAVIGLDDIRAVQPYSSTNDIDPTPVYLSQHTMDSVALRFPYLVPQKPKAGQELRRVAQLEWNIIEENCEKPFLAAGLRFVPLPVIHGEDYICLGFLFGEKCRIAYISDVSHFPEHTEHDNSALSHSLLLAYALSWMAWLIISKDGGGQLDLLILEANTLYEQTKLTRTHIGLPQSLDAIKRICPKQALLTGMTHEFDHHRVNKYLQEWGSREGISVQLAHDGLRIPMEF